MPRATVLLADDHAIVAEGLASLLRGEFALVGTVADGAQLVETARRLRPDLIVTDLAMPGLNGLDALRQLKADGLAARVVVLTMHADAHVAAEVLRAGASGFVVKHAAGQELIAALHAVLRGRRYVTPDLAEDVLATLSEPPAPGAGTLTPRQRDVVRLLAAGAHDEGGRRHARALAPHGRDPQVPEHGGAGAQDDGGADPLRSRARPHHAVRAGVAEAEELRHRNSPGLDREHAPYSNPPPVRVPRAALELQQLAADLYHLGDEQASRAAEPPSGLAPRRRPSRATGWRPQERRRRRRSRHRRRIHEGNAPRGGNVTVEAPCSMPELRHGAPRAPVAPRNTTPLLAPIASTAAIVSGGSSSPHSARRRAPPWASRRQVTVRG